MAIQINNVNVIDDSRDLNVGIATISSVRATNINATGVTTSSGGFVGALTGNVTGNLTGDVTGTATTATLATTATTANTLAINATGTNLTLSGNLTVNGTQTTINTQVLDVADKTVGVASTSTKTASTQDGGGLVIYGPTDINFTYDRNKVAVGLNTNLAVTGIVSATEFDIAGTTNAFTAGGLNVGIVTANDYDGNFVLDAYLFN